MTFEVFKQCVFWLASMYLIGYILATLLSWSPLFRDSTDKQGWFKPRSGVTIVRDELTGCQYLVTSKGGITPRILFGEQMGCEKVEDK